MENFKSIGSPGLNVEFRPLTIFVGPNGSGKSSILQALALLAFKVGGDFHTLHPDENKLVVMIVKTQDFLDMIHKRDPRKWLTLEVYIYVDEEEARRLANMQKSIDKEISVVPVKPSRVVGCKISCREERGEFRQSVSIGGQEIMRTAYLYDSKSRGFQNRFEYPGELKDSAAQRNASQLLSPDVFRISRPAGADVRWIDLSNLAQEIVRIIASKLKDNTFFLSALRGDVPYSPKTGRPPRWVGLRGESVVHILSLVAKRRHKEKREKIRKWAGRFGLVDVAGTWGEYDRLESDYADPSLDTALNTALASHGSKQVLSIILQLFWSEPGDVIMIEEPEISLHPDSQVTLAEMFAEAIRQGKQIIITTHSEFLLLALGKPVRAGRIDSKQVAIYHVEKNAKGTNIKELELTEKGFVKGWVKSFAETERALFKEWLKTVPKEE